MTLPFDAYEIRETERGAVIVLRVRVLQMDGRGRQAMIERSANGYTLKTWIAFDRLASTLEAVARRVVSLLEASAPPFPSAAEPPRDHVAGPAQPEAAAKAAV